MWSVLDRWLERVELFFYVLSAVAVAIMMTMIGADVAIRFVTGRSPAWLSEIPIFLNILMAFMAMAYVMRQRQHIILDVVLMSMSSTMQRIAKAISLIIAQVFFFTLLYAGYHVASRSYELGNVSYTSIEVPMFLLQACIPLGAFLLMCEGISQLAKTLWGGD